MLSIFDRSVDSKELYFKLNNSLQITSYDYQSNTFKFAGLYAIFKDGLCYYVGQSQNLSSRICQHLTGKYINADKVIIYFAVANGFGEFYHETKERRREILEHNEMALMTKLKPIENLITPSADFEEANDKLFSFFEDYEDCDYGTIFNNKNEIAVCYGQYPDTFSMYFLTHHNKKLLDDAEKYGFDIVRKEYCKCP